MATTIDRALLAYQNYTNAGQADNAARVAEWLKNNGARQELSSRMYNSLDHDDQDAASVSFRQLRALGMTALQRTPEEAQNAESIAARKTFNSMNPVMKGVVGIGKGANDVLTGVGQHVIAPIQDAVVGGGHQAAYQRMIANNRAADNAIMSSPIGQIGSTAGGIAMSAPLAMIPLGGEALLGARGASAVAPTFGKMMGAGALGGAGYGYITPSANEGEHVGNVLVGTTLGAALPAGAVGAANAARAMRGGIGNHIERAADAELAARLHHNPLVAENIARGSSPVGTERPILPEESLNADTVALTRLFRDDPAQSGKIATRLAENQSERANVLEALSLPRDTAVVNPVTKSMETVPQRTAMARAASAKLGAFIDKHGNAPVDDSAIIGALDTAKTDANDTVKSVVGKIARAVKDKGGFGADNAGPLSVRDWDNIRQSINDKISASANEATSGNPTLSRSAARKAVGGLRDVKRAITNAIDQAAPGYANAYATFRTEIAPANAAELVHQGLRSARSKPPNVAQGTALSLHDANRIAEALENSEFGVDTPAMQQALATAEAVAERSKRVSAAGQSIGSTGSATLGNLRSFLANQHLGFYSSPTAAGYLIGRQYGPEAAIAGGLVGLAGGATAAFRRQAINNAIADRILNPQLTRRALNDSIVAQAQRDARNRALLGANMLVQPGIQQRRQHPLVVPIIVPQNAPNPYIPGVPQQ